MLRDTWVEINLDHLAYNVTSIRERIGPNIAIAAVLKADAYGHGAVAVAETILSKGGDCLAVATLTEALELRKGYPTARIFIMGCTPDDNLEYAVRHDIVQCIFTLRQAMILDRLGRRYRKRPVVHIKYDTGFNRLGMKSGDDSIGEILKITELGNINVEGIFSHLALTNDESNIRQYQELMRAVEAVGSRGFRFRYRHICDSVSAIDYPEYNLDMVRPGAIIYGLKSFRKNDIELKPVMTFKTRIYHLNTLRKGEGVGYNHKWIAWRDSLIATLPVGYGDGYPRNMFGKGIMTIREKRVPVVGVICMDQCMIDVTDVSGAKIGDEVTIFGDGRRNSLDVAEVAKLGDTNKNEIVSRITRRTPRVYKQNEKIVLEKNYMDLGIVQ